MPKISKNIPLTPKMAFVLALVPNAIACGGPFLMLPGGALRGEVVDESVTDWSFATDRWITLETRPDAPYSVTLGYQVRDGQLYVDPKEGRRWLDHIRQDPRVRVRLGGRIYPATAVLAGRPGELPGFPPDRYVYQIVSRVE